MTSSTRETLQARDGFTIVEVVTASVILMIATMILMQFLTAGDRLYRRNRLVELATTVAYNEAESMRALAPLSMQLSDTTYPKLVGSRQFTISRYTITAGDTLDSLLYRSKQIEIAVSAENETDTPLVRFKFLQGYGSQE